VVKIVKRIGEWLRDSRTATVKEAQNARRRGADVNVPGDRELARKIEEGAFKKDRSAGELIEHEAHKKGYRPHFQTKGKKGHTFYGGAVIPGANLGDIVGRKTGSELLGEVVNFFNPLSDIQDVLDTLDYLTGGEEETAY